MTNKINGIDVSECKHFKNGSCGLETLTPCPYYKDCYFKQLKRLQQELDIKEKMLDKFMIGSGETLEKLQKENKELKEENKNYAKLMLEQQEISQKYWECIEKIKQAIEVLAETCNVYPLKTNLDKLITTINEVLNE